MDKDTDKDMDKDMDRIERQIIDTLHKEDSNCIFFHGDIGTGKTSFIKNLLARNNFIYRDFDICNKHTITEFIEEMNTTSHNIMDMFAKSIRKKVLVIDNIDILYEIDKTIITNLIKIVRPKKTKRQKEECYSIYPIICISNSVDKKLADLVKISKVIEFPSPNGDLRLHNYKKWRDKNNPTTRIYGEGEGKGNTKLGIKKQEYHDRNDVKVITSRLISRPFKFNEDILYINDNDKTTISLLYHENIVDYLPVYFGETGSIIEQYMAILDNICCGDYIDRNIFQKQLWSMNEMSFKIKVSYNNYLFHRQSRDNGGSEPITIKKTRSMPEMRFTKILTKYSNEYSNAGFMNQISQAMGLEIVDMLEFFHYYMMENIPEVSNDIYEYLMNNYNISHLDIQRINKYIDMII